MIQKLIPISMLFIIFFITSCDFGNKPLENKNNDVVEKQKAKNASTALLDSLILVNPKKSNLYFERAKIHHKEKFQPKALVDVLSAIRIDSSNANYFLLASDIFISMRQGDKAVEILEKGIQTNRNSEELFTRAIEYTFYLKDFRKSKILINDLLKMNKNNANAYFFRGMIYKSLDNNDKAISSFQTCVEQDPTFYNAYMQLGLLMAENKNDLAISYYDNALKLQNDSREALYGKGFYLQQTKKYNKAKKSYQEMISNDKNDFQAFYNYAYCLMEQDSLNKAFRNFKIASKIKVDYVDAIFMLGQISESIGDIPNAKKYYNTALKLLPDNETIKESLKGLN